jgi:quercetin dioxygenase-like cupin family protein
MMVLSRSFLAAIAFAAMAAVATASTGPVIVTPDTAKWQPVPQFKGWQMAIIVGNPDKAGAYYAYLLKAPAGGKAPPHFHRMTENVTVISGTGMLGLGDTIDVTKTKTFGPGTVVSIPGGVHHYAIAKSVVVLEVSGIGPDTTTFIHK